MSPYPSLVNDFGSNSFKISADFCLCFSASGFEKGWKEGEKAQESTKYTLVKILTRANPTDNAAGDFDFNAEYKIDFGSKAKTQTISALNIYTYRQDEMGNLLLDDNADIPDNVVVEKSNISRALIQAKKLTSIPQRRQVLRRLFLHWFRCKDLQVAAELTEFIKNEVERLKILSIEQARYFTSYWRRRGRREKEIFDSYDHWISLERSDSYSDSCGNRYNFHEASEYIEPDAAEAERWIKQSKADLDVAKMLLDKSYSQVCYMSQQSVEKILKGVLYAKRGIPPRELRTHYIYRLQSSVQLLHGAPAVAKRANEVNDYYLPTRYPDNQPKYKVPAEEYSEKQAKEALDVAEKVYTALEKFAHDDDH